MLVDLQIMSRLCCNLMTQQFNDYKINTDSVILRIFSIFWLSQNILQLVAAIYLSRKSSKCGKLSQSTH